MIGRTQLSLGGYGFAAKSPHVALCWFASVLLISVVVGLPIGASLWAQEQPLPPVAPAATAPSQPTEAPRPTPPLAPAPVTGPGAPVPAQPPQPSDFRPSVFLTGVQQRAAQ